MPIRGDVPARIEPAVVTDLDAFPPPSWPVVPFVECVQDRIAIEIMRGCPGKCRFCQSTTIKRPLRFRKVETIVQAALDQYRNTGYNEISLLSLSTSDYPHFDELMRRLQETFRPLGVSISLPSLRINEQLLAVGDLMNTDRHRASPWRPRPRWTTCGGRSASRSRTKTSMPVAAGRSRTAFRGSSSISCAVCRANGEADLAGIIEMAETIARLGQEIRGRPVTVVANVSNFVPKPQTPFQWNGMQRREYFRNAHELLHRRKRLRSVQLKCHDIETSLLEGVCVAAIAGSARRSSWHGAARPLRRLGRAASARVVVASIGRRRDRRRKNASPPLPRRRRPALGSYWDSARARIFGAGMAHGGRMSARGGGESAVELSDRQQIA